MNTNVGLHMTTSKEHGYECVPEYDDECSSSGSFSFVVVHKAHRFPKVVPEHKLEI